jgi:hypothetical protein
MGRRAKGDIEFDRELRGELKELHRREFMMRIEAIIFASPTPVPRETLAGVIPE